MEIYKSLSKQFFLNNERKIVPIRYQDRFDIMKWRNEQVYHLRQDNPLTIEDQENYFLKIINSLFDEEQPNQILFSYLENDICIGYGGLVHINWVDKNAEISFIMDTSLEEEFFGLHWTTFLNLIEQVAIEVNLHKIFTYAFDLRPHLYSLLEGSKYVREAVLKEHCFFEGKYIDVIIHSKVLSGPFLRRAEKADVELTLQWVNDPEIRSFSYNQNNVEKEDHEQWFMSKVESDDCEYYILEVNGENAGSVRFDIDELNQAKISYLIDSNFMGKGLGTIILKQGIRLLKVNRPDVKKVFGYVLKANKASIRIFEKLHFDIVDGKDSDLKYEKIIR